MDIYSTRAQLAALEQLPVEYTFLYDIFCKDTGTVEDDKAIYDYRKGVKRMAPFVHPGQGGIVMERDGYETREIGFCNIAPERVIDESNITGRMFGENVLGAMTPAQREKKLLAKDLMEMRQAIQRRREWMAREVLLNGKLSIFRYTHEGRELETTLVADYGFTNNYTPTNAWNTGSATIDDDMKEMYDLVYDGLGSAEVMVCSPSAASAMLHNSDYMKTFDYLHAEMGDIATKYRGQGVRYIGRNQDGVEVYSFSGKYVDDNGTAQPILPSGTVILGGRGMLNCVHGPVTQVEKEDAQAQHITYIKKEVPLRYGSIESNAIKNRLTSRPTIVPFNVDAWVVANVL